MTIKIGRMQLSLCLTLAFLLIASTAFAEPKVGMKVGNLKFAKCLTAADQQYLGLAAMGPFTLNDIKATYVFVEIFNTLCDHCQKQAPILNNLYQMASNHPKLKGKLKFVGVGSRDNEFGVMMWRQNYQVPFPLVPDLEGDIAKALKTEGTPTFVVLDQTGTVVYVHEGMFTNAEEVLKDLLKHLKL